MCGKIHRGFIAVAYASPVSRHSRRLEEAKRMRKLMVLVAMVALMLALAAPAAFAQEFEFTFEQELSQWGAVEDSVGSQVYNVGVQQANFGDQEAEAVAISGSAEAEAEDGSAVAVSAAEANAVNVGNAAGISIDTVNVVGNDW